MKLIERIETSIIWALMFLLLVSVTLGTFELGRVLAMEIFEPPFLLIDPATLFRSFGLFLVILIGLELLKLLKMHLSHHELKPELVIEVAIIAICNKIVTLDVKAMQADSILGLAALLFALSAGYYVFTRNR